jgi:hypothetical protein
LGVVSAHFALGADVSAFASVLASAAAAAAAERAGGDAEADLFLLRGALLYCGVRWRTRARTMRFRDALCAINRARTTRYPLRVR